MNNRRTRWLCVFLSPHRGKSHSWCRCRSWGPKGCRDHKCNEVYSLRRNNLKLSQQGTGRLDSRGNNIWMCDVPSGTNAVRFLVLEDKCGHGSAEQGDNLNVQVHHPMGFDTEKKNQTRDGVQTCGAALTYCRFQIAGLRVSCCSRISP